MKDDEFHRKVEHWLSDDPTRWERFQLAARALWHNKVPRSFRWWSVIHWLTKMALASSAPAVAYFMNRSIPAWAAITASVGILIGNIVVSLFDQLSKARRADRGGETELAVRFGEIIASFETKTTAIGDADDSIRSALGVIEIVARKITKSTKGSIAVSLATYNGSGTSEMRIRHRNPGNDRAGNRKFPTTYVLGHYAAQAGDPRVVHDLKSFGRRGFSSPTGHDVNYRSIYFIPVSRVVKGTQVPCGFISIDSTRAYAFYGNRDKAIIVTCEAFIDHVQSLL
ncbi:hypothetical protein ORIO_02175 [Cereibacter azotoformans]|uniref:GAF domain-containing protein n=1 Tax=Cereibacter sphaeroides (strain ATCC 17025 / ATH 2.4.3) TaxID=349102 RepID=A4WPM8_CERS5|nr:hypothetical protein [Cereibacter azotoformans]ULB08743.1 hypothetical protein ORIO_02175 [Cereibacter azotoformans]